MSEARDVDDRLTLEELDVLGAVRLPIVADRRFDDIEVIRIDAPSINVIEDVRG